MLIPACLWIIADTSEPLVADQIGHDPVFVDNIWMTRAVRAVIAVRARERPRANRRTPVVVGNRDRIAHIFGRSLKHRPRNRGFEDFDGAVTQESIP